MKPCPIIIRHYPWGQDHRHLGGTAPPSGRFGVRSRSRPSDQALRVLAASGSLERIFVPDTKLLLSLI